jgi:maltose alpha-D-glucosyltransferase/alpha-amylase
MSAIICGAPTPHDSRARINLGIRRRLAPLLENDRRKIQLLNALLLSMPGTPVLYYGDEIGMGDNFYLGDRDGVRTPMQWSADRNGGFSKADPQQLYLPPIMDANYGYQTINVEAQQRDPSSLLNWTRRMIQVRKTHAAFGRGSLTFLYPRNRKILAFLREHEGQTLLCVFNLARSAQAVELDLSSHRRCGAGRVDRQLGLSAYRRSAYMLTLPAYGFYWFKLERDHDEPYWRTTPIDTGRDLETAVFAQRVAGSFDGTGAAKSRALVAARLYPPSALVRGKGCPPLEHFARPVGPHPRGL